VLKLHGSVDWVKCDLCGWIVCNDDYFFGQQPYHIVSYRKKGPENTCACGHWPLRPVIVAPSLVRDIRDINILTVWKAAFEELRTADRWYMIGYSLPIDDYAIRSMLIRALKSRKDPPVIEVYQWGDNVETRSRYRAFFGERCAYHDSGMEGFIEEVVNRGMYV
jgi:NAD-dependent SIR2 family protein deacetylase